MFLIISGLVGWMQPAFSQCNPANMFVTGTTTQTPNITDVAQSFTTISACGNVNIGSITVYSTSSHTDATLKIFEGEGTGGTEIYSGAVNLNDQGNLTPSVMPVNSSQVFLPGAVYTFQITIPGTSGSFLNLLKSTTGDLYTGGKLYQNGVEQPNQDLFFSVNTTAAALPVELSKFEVHTRQRDILLTWQTDSEQNNDGFEIERSADGSDWEMIGFVEGNGTTSNASEYFFLDEKPMLGENYYRLRQVDFDGRFDYSMVKVVQFNNEEAAGKLTVAPNPARPGQALTISGAARDATEIRLLDLNGKQIKALALNEAGASVFDLPNDLQKGIYLLVFYSKYGRSAERVIVK